MAAGMSVSRNRVSGTGIRLSAAIAADYFALLKPRVMALSVFTAFVGLVMAPGVINPVVVIVAIAATSFHVPVKEPLRGFFCFRQFLSLDLLCP